MAGGGVFPFRFVRWETELKFFGENTEFGGPYREGETLFGVQAFSCLALESEDGIRVRLGVWTLRQNGSEDFADEIEPVVSLEFARGANRFVLGTLDSGGRHGLGDALYSPERLLMDPVEQGIQWIRRGWGLNVDLFLDWQKLNTTEHREVFGYGGNVEVDVGSWGRLDLQIHGVHHGGQLFASGPIFNNVAGSVGFETRGLRLGSVEIGGSAAYFGSKTTSEPRVEWREEVGQGALLGLEIGLGSLGTLGVCVWKGQDFFAVEGDRNYGSVALEEPFFVSRRSYEEASFRKTGSLGFVGFDVDARLHLIDGEFATSFRFAFRLPVTVVLSRGPEGGRR